MALRVSSGGVKSRKNELVVRSKAFTAASHLPLGLVRPVRMGTDPEFSAGIESASWIATGYKPGEVTLTPHG